MFLSRASLVAALLFFFSAALQLNDPDPIPWAAFYTVAGIVSAYAAFKPRAYPWMLPAVVGLIGLIWAATIAPHALGRIPLGRMFASWEMKNVAVEENRETFGLLIVAVWMAILVATRVRKPAKV